MSTPDWYTELTQDVPTPPPPAPTGPTHDDHLTDADVAAFGRSFPPTGPSESASGAAVPPAPAHRPRPRWPWAVGGLALLVAMGAGTWWVTRDSGAPSQGPAPANAAAPEHWNPRIAALVPQVEELRGLEFKHPVSVRFLSPAKFRASLDADQELSAEDRASLATAEGMFRALGMLGAEVDLWQTIGSLREGGTLAYYSWETQQITVRGRTLTPQVRGTVVHELTHALQDQHFDIGARHERYADLAEAARTAGPEDADNTAASTLFSAVVEGDAERVKKVWLDTLTESEKLAAQTTDTETDQTYAGLPSVVTASFVMPYVMGPMLVDRAWESGGNAGVDALFHDTPAYENVLLEPLVWGTGAAEVETVSSPVLSAGEEQSWRGGFGPSTLFQVLGERLDLAEVLTATNAWHGDAAVAFSRDGRTCVRARFAGAGDDGDRLAGALDAWRDAGPSGQATVQRDRDVITFESCDQGAAAMGGRDAAMDGLQLLALRGQVAQSMLDMGRSPAFARCYSNGAATRLDISDLTADSGQVSSEVSRTLTDLALECAAQGD